MDQCVHLMMGARSIMGNRTLDLLDGKADCPSSEPTALRTCADLSKPDAKVALMQTTENPATSRILAGFSLSDQALGAGLSTAGTAAAFALGGAGHRSAVITGEKIAATIAEAPIKIIGTILGMDPDGIGMTSTQKVLAEPYGPRVMKSALKLGRVGAAVGIVGYGLYEGYQYLTTDNTNK